MILNKFPLWKNLLVIGVIVIAFIYAAPNLFGEEPAVQISPANATLVVNTVLVDKVKQALNANNIHFKTIQVDHNILMRFASTDEQLKAKDLLQQTLGEDYLIALNLAPSTPKWLKGIGAMPMKYGLDLRGGVYLLLQVDVDSILKQRIEGDLRNISQTLREQHIRYSGLSRTSADSINLEFRTEEALLGAKRFLSTRFPEFIWTSSTVSNRLILQGKLSAEVLQQAHQDTLEQAMNTLRNRVNELGVSEAVVQQQGASRVAVDLPGIQDTAQAKNILGKTATLEFHLVDAEHGVSEAANASLFNSHVYYDAQNQPFLFKNDIILRGSSITNANSGFDENGQPSVNIRLGGGGESLFTKVTTENIGKRMGVLYVEVKSTVENKDGNKIIHYETIKRVISVATIQSALGNSFQITGLGNATEARNLALLLRAGALAAPVTVIEERQIGPSLGKQNIQKGVTSVAVGFLLVVVFMALYYGVMGLIADLALAMNLVLIVAILSLLGGTLTLPGIAGMVLTVGMAADANVLIFERIREELRNGLGIQASIHAGYERAFVTIIDANMTTLIVALVLFSLGSGAVKAFAITLTIGLLTSMFTAITGTRAVVNWLYGAKPIKRISIGI